MNVNFRIVENTNGAGIKQLMKQLKKANKIVKVGLPDSPHDDSKLTVAEIGMIHEYGAPGAGIPERPFLARSIREKDSDLVRLNRVNLQKILNNHLTFDQALNQLGIMAQGIVQEYIANGEFEPLKPKTIERKGSSKPLIDTGQMRQSVTYVVEGK